MRGADDINQPFVLSFKTGLELCEQPEGDVILQLAGRQITLPRPAPGLCAALQLLASGGTTEDQLADRVEQYDGTAGLPRLFYYLQRLIQLGLVCHTATWPGGRLATIVPISPAYEWLPTVPGNDRRYVLSHFAYFHNDSAQLVLESPLAHAKMVLHDWRATALLHVLTQPHSLRALCSEFQEVPAISVAMFLHLLLVCQALSDVRDGVTGEEETPSLVQWRFHDLLFHTRSRMGRHDDSCGATFRLQSVIEPLPAVKPPMSEETICLHRPDVSALIAHDVPFTRVLEARRSIRKHGEPPMTIEQLGEFLYRTARVRTRSEPGHDAYERSNRPYPSGGSCYELELYVVAHMCTGLAAGLYHYDPQMHQLHRIAGLTREVEALLESADAAADRQGKPQIMIVLAARFPRVNWKYDAIAYALILKHVGVVYQTMYLVATSMGLAACALGSGNSDAFSVAAGTNYYAETSVGEFMLGSMAAE